MPTYHYQAMYANGEKVEGVLEASSSSEAVVQIRRSYDVVINLTEIKNQKTDVFKNYRKVNLKAFSLMCKQFSIIMKSGLPIVQAVDLVANQTQDKVLKKLLIQVSEDISSGWSMSYSFEQRGKKILPSTFTETVKSGEESGDLIKAFQRMSVYYDRMTKTRAKATSAMIYPAFVLFVAAIVIVIIMTYAVPTFASTFKSLDMELPLMTKIVIGVSDFFSNYIWLMVLVIAGIILGVKLYARTAKGRIKVDKFKLALPLLGDVAVMTSASQFSHTMSTMLASGMPILQALSTASKSVSNACISEQIYGVLPLVEAGHSLGSCMEKCDTLPDMLVQMTATGEATGSLESILQVQAEYYDNEVDVLVARALSLLEPAIICVLAVVVVGVLLSIYMPMFSMYSAM